MSTPGINEYDADLHKTVRQTSIMRQLFYFVVLIVALAGQVSGAVEALGIPLIWAIPAVGALELGGIVVLANADVRRRLGEKATASRVLSAAIAAFAVAFNWMAHDNKLMAGFFAGMSALGYLVWLMHTENQRRDRLRAKGDLPPTTPAYEVVGHWLRHPWLTLRAKNLAKADPSLGLYSSIAAAKAEKRKEQRTSAIAKVLHRKIRSAVDPSTADIAVAVYDLDEIAVRLADGADYEGLTALIAADLAPARLAAMTNTPPPPPPPPAPALPEPEPLPVLDTEEQQALPAAAVRPAPEEEQRRAAREAVARAAATVEVPQPEPVTAPSPLGGLRADLEGILPATPAAPRPRRARTAPVTHETGDVLDIAEEPTLTPPTVIREGSLRNQVHQILHDNVPPNDRRDVVALTTMVGDLLDLDDVERLTASNYVRTWKNDVDAGRRTNGRHLQGILPVQG
ncbi:hypothetical protein Dvina_50475 [Dactylosporangium vinaceum]|uniref:Uncharacterized protein n=1 Tax=Dactylosporangium vinaceum TaxID=53362 RepID=A0ABV5M4R6_9ACTN|nr:hypothetical protein [Dactylosporangium vinaceum]UAB96091.1 hypothetical protein Dvina_50475 [Dactylosporangium vinaceum]